MILQIDGFEVHVFGQGEGGPCIFVGVSDREDGTVRLARCVASKAENAAYTLVVFMVTDWNAQLSPWLSRAAFGDGNFSGGGSDTFAWLTKRCVPELKAKGLICKNAKLFLAGYSFSGLFALWSLMESDLFDGESTAARNTKLAERLRDMQETGEGKVNAPGNSKVIQIGSRNKGAYPEIYQPEMSKVAEQQTTYGMNTLFNRLAQSKFRSSFALNANDRAYVQEKGMETITSHARDFVKKRLAPAEPAHDGKQTPMRGHPVFIAQHATATCCRGCLEKWHHIPKGQALTDEQQGYIVQVLTEWIKRQMQGYGQLREET